LHFQSFGGNFAIMKALNILLAALLAACILVGCKGRREFSVEVTAEGLGMQILHAVYSTPDGNMASATATAVDDKFSFTGSSSEPTVVEIFTSQNAPYLTLIACNGDKIRVNISADGTVKIEGSELSQKYLDATAALPADAAKCNRLILDYINTHPQDSVVFRALLATRFDHSLTDSLPRFTAPELLVKRDSVRTFPARGIWVFTSDEDQRTPELLDSLRQWNRQSATRGPLRDVYFSADTNLWRRITRTDSATWTQALLPAGPAAVPAIVGTPCVIQVDSTGHIIRRQAL
jgi:hypothetical protein